MSLVDQTILITGAGRRIGRYLAIKLAEAGANILIHYGTSYLDAEQLAVKIHDLGHSAWILQADLNDPQQVSQMMSKALSLHSINAVINNASIFEQLSFSETSLQSWQRHLNINLTAPFLISQAFSNSLPEGSTGRIINLLDWRALRPGADHFPYTISKAALASLTHSLAIALAPRITVNGIALGAILPPSDGGDMEAVLDRVPAARWGSLEELAQTALFLLDGPAYITGEIIHLDGGRHLL